MSRAGWILSAVLVVAGATPLAAADAPDLILAGGKVFTADPARPWAEAVAIAGARIVAVGSSAEVRPLAGRTTRVIELQKRVVVPGFNDAHMHLGGGLGPGVSLALRPPGPGCVGTSGCACWTIPRPRGRPSIPSPRTIPCC